MKVKHQMLLALSISSILIINYLYQSNVNIDSSFKSFANQQLVPNTSSIPLSTQTISDLVKLMQQPMSQINGGSSNCLSFDDEMINIIKNSTRVFITMPPKTAGSSIKTFAKKCRKETSETVIENWIHNPKQVREFLSRNELPKLIASHINNDATLLKLIPYITKKTPLIYIYRNEQDRLMSAIRQVVTRRICMELVKDDGTNKIPKNVTGNRCTIEQEILIDNVISPQLREIGKGAPKILTCDVYDAMKNNAANIIFVHYKQANRLQEIIAKQYCPKIKEPLHINIATEIKMKTFVELSDNSNSMSAKTKEKEYMELDDWMEHKIDVMEWALQFEKSQCQRHTKHLEDILLTCPDEMMQLSF